MGLSQSEKTFGKLYTLLDETDLALSKTGSAVGIGIHDSVLLVLDPTAAAHEAGDTMDVYVDASWDGGTSWFNIAHFTQKAGNAAASQEVCMLSPHSTLGTDSVIVTSDCAAAKCRPTLGFNALRGRAVLVDSGDHDTEHTFGLYALGR